MKSRNGPQYVIALTVMVCSGVLLAAMTFALSGYHWGTRGRGLEVDFRDATGIKLHSGVRYAGAVAGTVVHIRYLKPAERTQAGRDFAVRVSVRLDEGVPPLPSDVRAGISSETILGEKFVALSAGTPDAPPLADGAIIPGQSLAGIENLTDTLGTTAATATELLQRINRDYPGLKTNLTHLLGIGETVLSSGTNLIADAQGAITDIRGALKHVDQTITGLAPGATNLLAEATAATTNLSRTIGHAQAIAAQVREFLTNQFLVNLDQNLKHLTNVLAQVEVASEYAKILAERLAEKPSRLIWQMRTKKVPTEAEIRRRSPVASPRSAKP